MACYNTSVYWNKRLGTGETVGELEGIPVYATLKPFSMNGTDLSNGMTAAMNQGIGGDPIGSGSFIGLRPWFGINLKVANN